MFLWGVGRGKGSGAGCGYPEAKPPPKPSAFWETGEILSDQILLEILLLPWKYNISIVEKVFSLAKMTTAVVQIELEELCSHEPVPPLEHFVICSAGTHLRDTRPLENGLLPL